MNKNYSIFIEIIWAIFFLVSLILGIYNYFYLGITKSYMLFVVSAVSLLMFFLRRYMRKKAAK